MSFPSIAAAQQSTSISTNHVLTLPAGIQAGHLLIAVIGYGQGIGSEQGSWPAGWTVFGQGRTTGGSHKRIELAYRQADGTEGASITVTTANAVHSAHVVYRITGHRDPASVAPTASATVEGQGTQVNPPAHSPPNGAGEYLWLAAVAANGEVNVSSWPPNYTISQQEAVGGDEDPNGVVCAVAGRQLEATTEDPSNFLMDASNFWVTLTAAIPGAVDAPPAGGNGAAVHMLTQMREFY